MSRISVVNLLLKPIRGYDYGSSKWLFDVYEGEKYLGRIGYKETKDRFYVDNSRGPSDIDNAMRSYDVEYDLRKKTLDLINTILIEKDILG